MAIKSNKKGLFMTILILILFLLILGELVTFALLNYNYNTLDSSLALGSGSINYGKAFQATALVFANASLNRALYTLAGYELNSSMRKSNFITNTSMYLRYLIVNGTLPNVTANSLAGNYLLRNMGNLTLSNYNTSIARLLNLGAFSIKVNQSSPVIFQSSPYTLSLSYLQNVVFNSTAGRFTYRIPVNVSLSLNGTPDLYYYQQGVPVNVKFGSLSNVTNIFSGVTSAGVISPINATNGNFLGSIYGVVYDVPSGVTCANLDSSLPSSFTFAPNNQLVIVATANAIGITNGGSGPNCVQKYGGLVTYSINSLANPPAMPWLVYPLSSNILGNLKSGQQALILGNALSVYNIQNLINAAANGYYFPSPFTPSYLDRAQESILKQNPNGIFSLSNYNLQGISTQTSVHGGAQSYFNVVPSNTLSGTFTATLWFKPLAPTSNGAQYILFDGPPDCCALSIQVNTANNVLFNVGDGSVMQVTNLASTTKINVNGWNQVAVSVTPTTLTGYLNGVQVANAIFASSIPIAYGPTHYVSTGGTQYSGVAWDWQVADIQFYNKSLNSQQINKLYQQGLTGTPISNLGIQGWWPLNANLNDFSGYNINGIAVNILYGSVQNYTRDAIISTTVPTALSPIPGLLDCSNNAQCSNGLLPHAYLGYMPLGISQSGMQVSQYNGASSYVSIPAISGLPATQTISMWVNPNAFSVGMNQYLWDEGGNVYQIQLYDGDNNNGKPKLAFDSQLGTNELSAGGIWYHIVAVSAGSGVLKIYLNGALDSTLSGTNPSPSTINIGQFSGGNLHFQGQIANVQLYSNALNANQVTQLYNEGIQGLPIASNALAGWWPLNVNSNDYSGYSNNGIASNVFYPYFSGVYNSPGLSSITTTANEWQTIGLSGSGG